MSHLSYAGIQADGSNDKIDCPALMVTHNIGQQCRHDQQVKQQNQK